MKKKCECCGKKLNRVFSQTKYCSACSLYTQDLRQKVSYYRRNFKKLNKILYGQERGSERVR